MYVTYNLCNGGTVGYDSKYYWCDIVLVDVLFLTFEHNCIHIIIIL